MVLRVKLEIVPFGEEEHAREIGRLDIFREGNVTSPSGEEFGVSSYRAIDLTPGQVGLSNERIIHERSNGAWRLVQDVLFQLTMKGLKGP